MGLLHRAKVQTPIPLTGVQSQQSLKSRNDTVSEIRHDPDDGKQEQTQILKTQSLDPDETTAREDNIVYPSPFNLALITVALCCSIFCMALDNTIIATAIPRITDDFKALNDVGWYGSAYLLCTCAFQLFYGRLYTLLSLKWVYIAAIAIFEIGSAICGAAPNSMALIIGRAVAGLGAAGIFSGAVLIVSTSMPLEKRPVYLALVGGMYGLASVAGPLMGGAITSSTLTWRWCFYINLPIGLITILFILIFYRPARAKAPVDAETTWISRLAQFDFLGTVIFLPMIVCLLLALQWGGSTYAWSDSRVIALFVLSGLLLPVFIGIQLWRQDNGTVPPRVLKQRTVAAAAWFSFALGGAYFVLIYWIPIWFQAIEGATPFQSGLRTIPLLLSLVIAMVVCGALVQAKGQYAPYIIASSVIMSIGAGLVSLFKVNTDSGQWITFQIIFGIGVGLGYQNSLIAIQATLQPMDIPIGTAIIMFCQLLGGTVFISVAQNIFTNQLVSDIKRVAPGIDPLLIVNSGATQLVNNIPVGQLISVRAVYNDSLVSTFYVAAAMAAMSIVGAVFIEWKSVKKEHPGGSVA